MKTNEKGLNTAIEHIEGFNKYVAATQILQIIAERHPNFADSQRSMRLDFIDENRKASTPQ